MGGIGGIGICDRWEAPVLVCGEGMGRVLTSSAYRPERESSKEVMGRSKSLQ